MVMVYQIRVKKILLILTTVLLVFLNRPMQAHASGFLVIGGNRHHEHAYRAVVVSGNRYYYDQGVFYTGYPGNYVVVDAPYGAVIYDIPIGYEQVEIEGNNYYRYHNVYYRHNHRGYEVVRVQEHHDQGEHRGGQGDDRHDHGNDHRDDRR